MVEAHLQTPTWSDGLDVRRTLAIGSYWNRRYNALSWRSRQLRDAEGTELCIPSSWPIRAVSCLRWSRRRRCSTRISPCAWPCRTVAPSAIGAGLPSCRILSYDAVCIERVGCLLVPGGNPDGIAADEQAMRIVREAVGRGDAVVAGICAGVAVLGLAGVLRGRRVAHNYTVPTMFLWKSGDTRIHFGKRTTLSTMWHRGRRPRDHRST